MKHINHLLMILFILTPLCTGSYDAGPKALGRHQEGPLSDYMTDFLESLAESERTGKPVFAYFESKSCGYCRLFESEVLSDPAVIEALDGFIPLVIDNDLEKELSFNLGIRGTPTSVFLEVEKQVDTNKSSVQEITRIVGYVEKDEFLNYLQEIK